MSILDEADNIVNGDRAVAYGPAERNLSRIAELWTTYLGHDVTARDVTMCMILLKVGRDAHKAKRDNLVDIAGYAELADQLEPVKPEPLEARDAVGRLWRSGRGARWDYIALPTEGGPLHPATQSMLWPDLVDLYGPMKREP